MSHVTQTELAWNSGATGPPWVSVSDYRGVRLLGRFVPAPAAHNLNKVCGCGFGGQCGGPVAGSWKARSSKRIV